MHHLFVFLNILVAQMGQLGLDAIELDKELSAVRRRNQVFLSTVLFSLLLKLFYTFVVRPD
jgi:hypothetical protein